MIKPLAQGRPRVERTFSTGRVQAKTSAIFRTRTSQPSRALFDLRVPVSLKAEWQGNCSRLGCATGCSPSCLLADADGMGVRGRTLE